MTTSLAEGHIIKLASFDEWAIYMIVYTVSIKLKQVSATTGEIDYKPTNIPIRICPNVLIDDETSVFDK